MDLLLLAHPGVDVLDDELALVVQAVAVGARVVERHLQARVLVVRALQTRPNVLQLSPDVVALQAAANRSQ